MRDDAVVRSTWVGLCECRRGVIPSSVNTSMRCTVGSYPVLSGFLPITLSSPPITLQSLMNSLLRNDEGTRKWSITLP
eukprot:31643-Eustigmatos_ZCMA.PRE.1